MKILKSYIEQSPIVLDTQHVQLIAMNFSYHGTNIELETKEKQSRSLYNKYSVSQKSPPATYGFLTFFHKRLRILNQFLHTYYTFLSTLDYKFLLSYLKL